MALTQASTTRRRAAFSGPQPGQLAHLGAHLVVSFPGWVQVTVATA